MDKETQIDTAEVGVEGKPDEDQTGSLAEDRRGV
jgi:hypothetical protein